MDANLVVDISEKLADLLTRSAIIDTTTKIVAGRVVMIAIIIAMMLFFLSLAYNYMSVAMKSLKDKSADFFVDYEEIARTGVLIGCLVIYVPLIQTVVEFGEFFNRLTSPSSRFTEQFDNMSREYLRNGAILQGNIGMAGWLAAANDPNIKPEVRAEAKRQVELARIREEKIAKGEVDRGPEEPSNKEFSWYDMLTSPAAWVQIVSHAIFMAAAQLVKMIVTALATGVLKVLIIIGPLAFAFSIIPAYKKQLEIWASTVLGTLFVFTTINILEHIQGAGMAHLYYNPGEVKFIGYNEATAYNIVTVILYTMSFWLTSKVIGKGDAGRVLSKTLGVAALAATAGMAGGAAAAAGGGSNAGSAAQAGANVIGNDGD